MLPDEITIKFNPKLLLVSPLAVFPLIGLFFLPWDAVSAPAWVQAVGSIAAIFAAWMIPYFREKAQVQKARADLLDSAGWLALRIRNSLESMASVIERTGLEEEPHDVINRWRFHGQPAALSIHRNAADELPLAAFTGRDISLLLAIRAAASFGAECAKVIDDWDFEEKPDMVRDFPLNDRMVFHKSQIGWVLENTLNRVDK